jgi:hypothetical protein
MGRITASEWIVLLLNVAAALAMVMAARLLRPSETGGVLFAVTAIPWSAICVFWLVRNVANGYGNGRPGSAYAMFAVTVAVLAYIGAPLLPSNALGALAKYVITLPYLLVVGVCAILAARRWPSRGVLIASIATFATVAFAIIGTGIAAS